MKLDDLLRFNVPPAVIGLWKGAMGERLLPVQEAAVKRHGLFEGGNMLVQAPTSSGKTFIGEMAAVQTALRRKKVVYLVPLKALAEEKYREFKAKYSEYGIKVIVSSRDHREFDGALESGDFSIAVVVYEKLAQLLVRRPERLAEIELVIADELEILSDPERGGMAELLLTRVLQSGRRLIGLSAVIGAADELAAWMKARLVQYEQRPVELRYGVLCDGRFRYRMYNGMTEATEELDDAPGEGPWEVLTRNVCRFAEEGETSMVFVKAKHESRRGARLLAERMECPAAEGPMAALRALEATQSREALLETLAKGVAFHNADLSPEERRIVEHGFRTGAIRALVSTGTLAVGMNLPARNVFITADKWRYDERFNTPWKAPILRSEYENMGGRAGRYGVEQDFGRSILIAATPFEQEALWRRYVEGEREPVDPCLAREPLENYVLQLAASRACRTEVELRAFLDATLTGQWVWKSTLTEEEAELRVKAAIHRAADAGALTHDPDGRIEATPLGLALASKGLSISTGAELEAWVVRSQSRSWSPVDLLFAAALTPDGRSPLIGLTAEECDGVDYPAWLRRVTAEDDSRADVPLNRVRNSAVKPFFDDIRAIKTALLLNEWIEQTPLCELEERFHTLTGQILAVADQVSWLVDGAAAIATALGAAPGFVTRLRELSERVQRGLRKEALPVGRVRDPGPSRAAIAALVSNNLHTPEALVEAPARVLEQWMPKDAARALKAWAGRTAVPLPGETTPEPRKPLGPSLIVDDRYAGQIELDGVSVTLQEKQYRLIRLLAQHPGECVPYERIYREVWGDAVVEDNQMHFQKRQLLERIENLLSHRKGMIKTIPKRGFALMLSAQEVAVRLAHVSTAA